MSRTTLSGSNEISQRRRALEGTVRIMGKSLAESKMQQKLQHQQFPSLGKLHHAEEERGKELAREIEEPKNPKHINATKNVSRGNFDI